MGTVGLSFGSPTSGQGFDVSATVSTIVANLEDVETPWKTQLSALENQDTAISNLGTLLSNLSNDMSSLTDLSGVLAEKTGSSSNPDVLELTSASTSAAAGTHTVTVNSLAQTASGYLAALASAADTLSGSVTIAVGGGSGTTITLNSSDDTLSGLAAAINASGAGVTASVLTDANGSRLSLVSGTSGAGGNITISDNQLTAAVANTLGATVTAGAGSAASTAVLSPVVNASETLTGTLNVTVGSGSQQTIDMNDVNAAEGGTTLADLAAYIHANSATLGFDATTVTNSDGTASLSLTSNTAGSAGTLAVNSQLADSATSLAYTNAVSGSNASLTVDGVELSSASNTVTNLIPGLTMQLLATSSSPVQVVIGNYNSGVESTLNQFVSDYNSLVSAINTQEGTDSSGNAEPLFGSPTLTLLQQDILGGVNAPNPSGYLTGVPSDSTTTLSGSMTIRVGSGTATPITMDEVNTAEGGTTLTDLEQYINSLSLGVTAAVATSEGESTLTLTAQASGASGALTVTSALTATDSDGGGSTPMNYTNSSDIGNLTGLGISVNNDGTISLDMTSLDAVLNSDFSGVQGLFQNLDSWGMTFSNTLTDAGTSSSTGLLALATSSNSSTESSLNAEISREQSQISAEQSSLTAELNSANQILQQLPSELAGVNELYSAITGYNQNTNG